ncbi:dGTP triphosphohydrolase [Methanolapillus millepedarum]|uniref:Deoxyguanosinetriphosphate triphosphohydrolase n=1 Tax=Methanolapillus millepedarum TaxID=3028296 RepID=A0AA96V3W4_9EURY|nr:Deoxyguanosinetriphosphate triphosphohydrolase [Methanosarcinaceae archaeon Ac7]
MKPTMDLNKLYSDKRITDVEPENEMYVGLYDSSIQHPVNPNYPRSNYQRDFDRIVFSSSFRRLQNKTQVFPLPGSKFVHNRLTHSLEVASVGRSLGVLIGDFISTEFSEKLTDESKRFYERDLSSVIAAACLCHDIGNPPFGHSGEDSIAEYFRQNESLKVKYNISEEEWLDLINFEGNSNSIRCLVLQQKGKSVGGLNLTYSTLAAIMKYPCSSTAKDKTKTDLKRNKFGYLTTEKEIVKKIAHDTGMIIDPNINGAYFRHPFVWLVEAADDICNRVIDLEDAHRLKIIPFKECSKLLFGLIEELKDYLDQDEFEFEKIKNIYDKISDETDENDMISYLRAKSINTLIIATTEKYKINFEKILDGSLNKALYELVEEKLPKPSKLKEIEEFQNKKMYDYSSVVEIKNAGYNVMYELLDHFIKPVLKEKEKRTEADKTKLKLLPKQFETTDEEPYKKILCIIDYVSGMTDNYASDLYKKIKGINMGLTD